MGRGGQFILILSSVQKRGYKDRLFLLIFLSLETKINDIQKVQNVLCYQRKNQLKNMLHSESNIHTQPTNRSGPPPPQYLLAEHRRAPPFKVPGPGMQPKCNKYSRTLRFAFSQEKQNTNSWLVRGACIRERHQSRKVLGVIPRGPECTQKFKDMP